MPEFNPIVLRRMLVLRQLPLLAGTDLHELASVAENLVEMDYSAGAVIVAAGARVPTIQIVVEGRIESGPGPHVIGPRQIFGALEVLARRPATTSAIATTATRTLQLSAPELGEVLEDNFGVLLATLRRLASGLLRTSSAPPPAARVVVPQAGPLGLVERLVLLRQQVPFAAARLQALATLALSSEERVWSPGEILASINDPATHATVIIDGTVRVRDSHGRVRTLGAGEPVGYLETLAGVPHGATFEAVTHVRALANASTQLLDVLEDHTDLGLAMISTFAGALLDASVTRRSLEAN